MKLYILHPLPIVAHALSSTLAQFDEQIEIIAISKFMNLKNNLKINDSIFLLDFDEIMGTRDLKVLQSICESDRSMRLILLSDNERKFIESFLYLTIDDIVIERKIQWNEFRSKVYRTIHPDAKPESISKELTEFKLTKRQIQILQLSSLGKGNREISEILGISEHTIKVHAWRLYKSIGVKSRLEALAKARNAGYI